MSYHLRIFPTTQCWTHTKHQQHITFIVHESGLVPRVAANTSTQRVNTQTSMLCTCSRQCTAAIIRLLPPTFSGLLSTLGHVFIFYFRESKNSAYQHHRKTPLINRDAFIWM